MFAPGYKGGKKDTIGYDVGSPDSVTTAPTGTLKQVGGNPVAPKTQPNGPLTTPPVTTTPANDIFAQLMRALSPETTVALQGLGDGQNPGGGTVQPAPLMPQPFRLPPGSLFGGSLFGRMK